MVLVTTIKLNKPSKLVSVIPKLLLKAAPKFTEIIEPKFNVDISKAYMVPSILLGHILQAKTNSGIVFNSPTTIIIAESPIVNNLSGIPYSKFFLSINQ
jgi:hypothetical protein